MSTSHTNQTKSNEPRPVAGLTPTPAFVHHVVRHHPVLSPTTYRRYAFGDFSLALICAQSMNMAEDSFTYTVETRKKGSR